MMKNKIIYFTIPFLFFLNSICFGQYFDASHYTEDDGLPFGTVTSFYQDYKGFIWVASTRQLVRFDSKSFEDYNFNFNIKHEENLIITDIEGDTTGLFISTNRRLYFYNFKTKAYTNMATIDSAFNIYCTKLIHANENEFWAIGKTAILRFNNSGEILQKFIPKEIIKNPIEYLYFNDAILKGDYIWLAFSDGNILKFNYLDKTTQENLSINSEILTLCLDKNGLLWIGTNTKGVYYYNPNNKLIENISEENGLTENRIRVITEYTEDFILIGTNSKGINFYDKSKNQVLTCDNNEWLRNKLSFDMIYSTFTDRQNNIWIGTIREGIFCLYYPFNNFQVYNLNEKQNLFKYDNLKIMRIDKNDVHYIATRNNGILVNDFKNNRFETIDFIPDRSSDFITQMIVQDSTVWFTSLLSFHKYDMTTKQLFHYTNIADTTNHKSVFYNFTEETDSTFLLSLKSIFRFNKNKETFETVVSSEDLNTSFYNIKRYKEYWVCTSPKNGLFILDQNFDTYLYFNENNSALNSRHTYDIEIVNDNIYISAYTGIFQLDSNFVLSAVDTSFGRGAIITDLTYQDDALWCGTTKGIFRIDLQTHSLVHYNEFSNLPFLSINWWSSAQDSSGNIYFTTDEGIVYFNPSYLKKDTTKSKTYITEIQILNGKNNTEISEFENILSDIYSKNSKNIVVSESDIFTIKFSSTNYRYPIKNYYSYKMDGIDEEWTSLGNNNQIIYHHLPKGNYVFHVKNNTQNSDLQNPETKFTILVKPIFIHSLIFKILVSILTGISIYLLLKYRIYLHTLKEKELKNFNAQLSNEISHRKLIENKLMQTNSLLNSIMNSANNFSIIATDTKGIITYFNYGAELMLEYSADEIINKTSPYIFHDKKEITKRKEYIYKNYNIHVEGIDIFVELAKKSGLDNSQWTYITKTGKKKNVDLSISLIRENSEVIGYLGVAIDITEKIKNERQIKENERKLSTLLSNIQGMAYRCYTDENWTMKYISPGVFDLTGYKPEELIDNNVIAYNDIINNSDKYFNRMFVKELIYNKQPFEISYRIHTKNNIIKWVLDKGCGVYDENDNIIAIEGFITDISEYIRIKTELEKNNKFIDNIINSMPQKLIALDNHGMITRLNKNMVMEYDGNIENIKGKFLLDVFPFFENIFEEYTNCLSSKTLVKIEKNKRKKNGQIFYEEIIIYPLIDEQIIGAVIMFDDITEKIRLEEIMVQSEKMLSVGGLAAGMAHEINNPLAGMMQNASVLKSRLIKKSPKNLVIAEACDVSMDAIIKYSEQRQILKQIDLILSSGQRAAEIVKNMLSFARQGDSKFNIENPIDIVEQTLEIAKNDYNLKKKYDFRKITIMREYDDNIPLFNCEKTKLQQVFLNILKNGAEAMYDENFHLLKNNLQEKELVFKIKISTDGENIIFKFIDNGPGISDNIKQRIFEPFFTTKDTDKGTGLGLSVSYFIIKETHSGKMYIESEIGRGTTFVIIIPKKLNNYEN